MPCWAEVFPGNFEATTLTQKWGPDEKHDEFNRKLHSFFGRGG